MSLPAPHLSNPRIPPPEGDEDHTQLALMIAGEPYQANDKYLDRLRNRGAIKLDEIVKVADMDERMTLWREFGNVGEDVLVVQRFFCEYGFNVHFKGDNFIGANCTFLDICPNTSLLQTNTCPTDTFAVTIGLHSMVGPDVKIYTPDHPLSPEERSGLSGKEWGKPIVIEDNCWICGGATILPGVTIGKGSTVGAGSVVTRDVPERSVVVGNPARVVKKILEDGTVVKA
ncbi:maltose O-acetyltransferase [Cryptococcus wingfieldii CBS 7118]|uniref:Maltose O-acetyltransferase n=1 Tax=Cryptococcus wingfieldii CBS 7118 TaxID=1295528 RepID=A0A1E3JZ44_9TREE|nr:maltose O-acetyltransferase [Cryptococcus wingfieldii CBS 7118]ODO06056.1 maltose O-acetyltransferase [Cryptococcus wingfieldii CBS 7118]